MSRTRRSENPRLEDVPAAEVGPHLRVVGDGVSCFARDAEEASQHAVELDLEPFERAARAIREGDDADPIVGRDQERGVEARQDPVVANDPMLAELASEEAEADVGDTRVGLEPGAVTVVRIGGSKIARAASRHPPGVRQ